MERLYHSKVIFRGFLIFLILLVFPSSSSSQEVLKLNVPFTKIVPLNTTTLMGISNHVKAKIPIPERWNIKSAVINFSYVNSTALLQSRSRLVVWLNDHPVAQITLNPHLPQGKVSVNLPVSLLKPGYNELNFSVSQHYTLECEDPSSPELWTTIEFDKASFDFEISLKRVPENLSAISNFLFDSKIFGKSEINIAVEDKKEESLEMASIVASAIALRFEYRPVNFSLSDGLKKGVDNVIIGGIEFIKSLTNIRINEKGSLIMITTPSDDPYHANIILKGDNTEELKKSVLTFASLNFPFPMASFMKIENVSITPQIPPSGRGILVPGYEYSLKELGFFTTNFQGVGAKSALMGFKLPSNIFLKPNSFMSLKINFSYGSGMRKDSVLNLQINGKYFASIHLENIKGGFIRNYVVDVPLSLLRPGYNYITFTAVLSPLITGYCEFVQTENLQLTIFDDSKLSLPSALEWTHMPNLSLFFMDAFPFSKPVDFSSAGILITEKDNETLSTVINIIAQSAQRAGYVPFKIKVSYDKEKLKDKNIIVVGTTAKIPSEFLKDLGIQTKERGDFIYYLAKHFEKGETSLNAKLRFLLENIFPIFKSKSEFLYSKSQIKFSGEEEGNWMALIELESPFKNRNTVLIFTASDRDSLAKGVYSLWEPSLSSKVAGALTVFDPQSPDETISSYHTDKFYYIGKMGFLSAFYSWIYAHPIAFTVVLLIAIAILVYMSYRALRILRRRRLNVGEN